MKNGRNLRRLILFSLAAGGTLGGLGSGDVYADAPPYEQILYINEDNTVTQNDKDPSLTVDTSGLLKDGNFTYDTGDKLSKEKRGLIIWNSQKNLKSYKVHATLGADSSKTVNDYNQSDYQTVLLEPKYDGTTIHDVNLQVDGLLAHKYGGGVGVYGIYSSGAMSLDNLTIKSDLTNAIKDSGIVNTNAYFIGKGTTNIGNLYIDTKLDPKSTTGASIAHNGLYADGGPSSMSRGIPISTIISPREPMKAMTMSMKSILRGTLIPSARTMPYQLSTVTVRRSISMPTKMELS